MKQIMIAMAAALDLCAAAGPAQAQQARSVPRPSFPPSSAAFRLPVVKPMPIPQYIFGIKVYVSDLDRSMKFYADLFDMDILGKAGTGGRAVSLAFKGTRAEMSQAGGASLTLLINPIPAQVAIRNPAIVITVPDLNVFKQKAASLGVKLDTVGDVAGFGQDPDGNWFEIVRPGYLAAPER